MNKRQSIKLFEKQKVRTVWDDKEEKWYFCVVDVVEALTDSINPTDYIKKMKKRDPELAKGWGQIVTPLSVQTPGGKQRVNCATQQGIFRIIQSIPSKKAEPFKQWMAQVASQRIDQMQDPELSIEQAIADYKRLGYSDAWINQRIKSIEVRKELTDEWKRTGVQEGLEYASLTDIITREWSGFTTRQYKQYKGLKKESLRDNMTNIELALNILAEASTTEISKAQNPKGFKQSAAVARKGGEIAGDARKKLEAQTGRAVITRKKASDYLPPSDSIQELPEETEI
ncbi:MAG: Bro-N domain-containing protein [Prevotella sp.]|nr:Bro-N domain-containing protein [Prevotella sp.]